MGCVEIDVGTDTLEYHPDIDCCPVEWRTHHCVNVFSKCMFCALSSCFHSDRQLWEWWYWDNDEKWWVVWMRNEDEWVWCDEVICVVTTMLTRHDTNGWIGVEWVLMVFCWNNVLWGHTDLSDIVSVELMSCLREVISTSSSIWCETQWFVVCFWAFSQ